jgi:hypothetical protein
MAVQNPRDYFVLATEPDAEVVDDLFDGTRRIWYPKLENTQRP